MTLFVFCRCSAHPSCSAALEYNWPAIPGDNFVILTKIPQSVILAGRRGSSYGYVVTRSVTQPL